MTLWGSDNRELARGADHKGKQDEGKGSGRPGWDCTLKENPRFHLKCQTK